MRLKYLKYPLVALKYLLGRPLPQASKRFSLHFGKVSRDSRTFCEVPQNSFRFRSVRLKGEMWVWRWEWVSGTSLFQFLARLDGFSFHKLPSPASAGFRAVASASVGFRTIPPVSV